MTIKIDHNVPIPSPKGDRKYPFGTMEVGESFFVAGKINIQYHAYKPRKFTQRIVTENGARGLRVWRIE